MLGLNLDAEIADEAPLPEGAADLECGAAARAARDFVTSDAPRGELAPKGV